MDLTQQAILGGPVYIEEIVKCILCPSVYGNQYCHHILISIWECAPLRGKGLA